MNLFLLIPRDDLYLYTRVNLCAESACDELQFLCSRLFDYESWSRIQQVIEGDTCDCVSFMTTELF